MDIQAVRRRTNIIANHLAASETISATATHLFSMNCSNSLNSAIRRCDNRMYFARQSSSSQGTFMRQASSEQAKCAQPIVPFKPCNNSNMEPKRSEVPMFSRPCDFSVHNSGDIQWLLQVSNYPHNSLEPPCFAQPVKRDHPFQPINIDHTFQTKERNQSLKSIGSQWSPRTDVTESGHSYIVTAELPGVSIRNIRVEVSDKNLMVIGRRSIQCGVSNCSSENTTAAYNPRETAKGPYKIVWPLPTNVNKDSVSAEYSDGLLQITIPKLS